MIKNAVILMCWMWMPLCSFCQTGFPRKAVIDGDTVCMLSIGQVKLLDKVFIDRAECRELNDSLSAQLKNYQWLEAEQKKIIAAQKERIALHEQIIEQKDVSIASDSVLLKKQEKKMWWLRVQKYIYGGVGAGIGIGVGILAKTLYYKITDR